MAEKRKFFNFANLGRNFRAKFANVHRGYTETSSGEAETCQITAERTPVLNVPCPTHTINHYEGRTVHCGYNGSSTGPTIRESGTIVVMLGAICTLSVLFQPVDPPSKKDDTDSAEHEPNTTTMVLGLGVVW